MHLNLKYQYEIDHIHVYRWVRVIKDMSSSHAYEVKNRETGADLGILEWWGCMSNAHMKSFRPHPLYEDHTHFYCPAGQQPLQTAPQHSLESGFTT